MSEVFQTRSDSTCVARRPAKGRFREFYQCDVDITGTTSLLAEAEVMHVISGELRDIYDVRAKCKRIFGRVYADSK